MSPVVLLTAGGWDDFYRADWEHCYVVRRFTDCRAAKVVPPSFVASGSCFLASFLRRHAGMRYFPQVVVAILSCCSCFSSSQNSGASAMNRTFQSPTFFCVLLNLAQCVLRGSFLFQNTHQGSSGRRHCRDRSVLFSPSTLTLKVLLPTSINFCTFVRLLLYYYICTTTTDCTVVCFAAAFSPDTVALLAALLIERYSTAQ